MATPVVWASYHEDALARGYWDQAILEEMLEGYDHRTSFKGIDGGIVIINGRMHTQDTARLNKDISKLKWCLLIITGDEEAVFPWREVHHPLMRVWVQLARKGQHDDVSFHLPNGYRPTTRKILGTVEYQERTLDWFFAGQINHPRRQQCVDAIKPLPSGRLVETDGFGKEDVEYTDYLNLMARAKIIPCPSGVESPDNFRLYEALEAGCIPVVDAYSTNNPVPGFWQHLFGDYIPFPIITEWSAFPLLKNQLLMEWPHNANRIFSWWLAKKRSMKYKLEEDIKALHG